MYWKITKKYHLIFLDIEISSIDGIATAKRINDLKGTAEIPFIIFVTSHDELVFDALKSFPYSFIRKNMIDIDLSECVSRINSYFKQIHQTIILHSERKDIPIIIDEIVYLEKIKNYV
ncbi:response regulator, partial [Ruminococcus bromii]